MLLQLKDVEYSVPVPIEFMVSSAYAYGDQPYFSIRRRMERTSSIASERFILFVSKPENGEA